MTINTNLHKLISLTFDEDADVRKKAAEELAKYPDDPAAVFALVELSYDKDESVRNYVLELLKKHNKGERKMMSFADIFGNPHAEEQKEENKTTDKSKEAKKHHKHLKSKREKLLEPIVKMFERTLGKEKAEEVSKKLMPTIEKIYDKIQESETEHKNEENRRRMMQAVLSEYLSAFEDVEPINPVNGEESETATSEKAESKSSLKSLKTSGKERQTQIEDVSKSEIEEKQEGKEEAENENEEENQASELLEEISSVSGGMDVNALEKDMEILSKLEHMELPTETPEENYKYKTLFGKAYEIMLATDGDETIMKREMNRLIAEAKKDIKLAFKVARDKFRAKKIVLLPDLKDRMRNIYTDVLTIKDISVFEYGKRKKKQGMRILVSDKDDNEGVVYLFDGRGSELKVGMHIKIEKGYVRTFDFSGETGLTIGKTGSLYVVV